MNTVLGVDLGGTRLRAVLRTRTGRLRRFAIKRPAPEALLGALSSIKGRTKLDGLVIGARGVWTKQERDLLSGRLKPLARSVRVISDVELAWRAALGTGEGVVIVAGTGAIALARSANGRLTRAGGLGPLIGDEGSGFWIGKQWLKTRSESEQRRTVIRPDAVCTIAGFSKRALREKPSLAAEAAAHLAAIANQAANNGGLRGKVRLSWQGGLFSHELLRRRFLKDLPGRFNAQPPRETPEEAAAKLLP